MLLNVAEIHTIGCDLGIFRAGVLDKQVDDRWFHLGRGRGMLARAMICKLCMFQKFQVF